MDHNNRITITVCGDGGCGKSSITLRLVRSQWTHEYDPTIEDSYSVTRTIDGTPYFLMLTDTAGQEEYRGLWAASNLKSDAFLLVYDITNPSSLDALEYFMEMIEMESDNRIDSGEVPPVTIVAGNKCDLQAARQIKSPQGLEWARKRQCGFMETSARDMVNIEETFALLVRRVVEARRLASGDTAAAAPPSRTVGFAPNNEKGNSILDASTDEKRGGEGSEHGFWSKLKCW
ncbi:ras-domain-containing protein [Aaosphaeria arxii CBS 175.79]|uniref:Ras-domain-containing protein n=1 Tax=Aaosphaeria arxii CBS 175.79 TaxID=1450172 RepID=A0A6A5Y0N6_9PLEO|nr:ras-domain-containing protein [Aaosphaeria arxii CBS 175.79]KAF2018491.1 ras-domain-containing protein [Aaosphaeria arxii CBS 175.79]